MYCGGATALKLNNTERSRGQTVERRGNAKYEGQGQNQLRYFKWRNQEPVIQRDELTVRNQEAVMILI